MADPVHVLVVEDDRLTRTLVRTNLAHEGYDVTVAVDGHEGMAALGARPFDVFVFDYMLPGHDGLALLAEVRRRGLGTPVLMLTARDETGLKVRALDGGADDYLTKPFHVDELVARVRALVRRARAPVEVPAAGRVRFGAASVDLPGRRLVDPRGQAHTLGEKEIGLIVLFSREPGRVHSRADILEEVWGMEANPVERTVDNYIHALRQLVEPDPDAPRHVVTVRGEGYRYDGL
jgi:DNA-binding response OmpR family regulator